MSILFMDQSFFDPIYIIDKCKHRNQIQLYVESHKHVVQGNMI